MRIGRKRVAAIVAAFSVAAGCGTDEPTPPTEYRIEFVQAPPATAPASRPLADSVVVRVTDEDGDPLIGVPVSWSVAEGGGAIAPVADTSGLDGLVGARWTLGRFPGRNRLAISLYGQPANVLEVEGTAFRADYVDAGLENACALRGTELWCWGSHPPLDATDRLAVPVPERMQPSRQARELVVADGYTCIIEVSAGPPLCRGNIYGRDPGGAMRVVQGAPPVFGMVAGDQWVCGLAVADSTPWCWGGGSPLGASARHISTTLRLRTLTAGGGSPIGCGLAADSTAWCWGAGGGGPVEFEPGARFRQLSAGGVHLCVIRASGGIACRGDWPVTGAPPGTPPTIFVDLTGVGGTSIAAGFFNNFALFTGNVTAWGFDFPSFTPLSAYRALRVTQISADDSACLRAYRGDIYCTEPLAGLTGAAGFTPNDYFLPVLPEGFEIPPSMQALVARDHEANMRRLAAKERAAP